MNDRLKFKRHFQVVKKDDLKRYARVVMNPTLSKYKEILEDYLRILRLRFPDNILAIIKLQHNLLTDIAISERTIREYKRLLKDLDKQKDSASHEYYNTTVDLHVLVRNKLKEIGDALAWKLVNYDRSIIYIFSNRPDSGFIQIEGMGSELLSWLGQYYSEGKISILNSVTNCLRIGDITTKDRNSTLEVYEIKSSKRSSRNRKKKQLEIMDGLVSLLNDKVLMEGNMKKKIIELSFYPQNYFDKFRDLISQAYNKGYGLVKLNDFSFLDIINFELADDFDKAIRELEIKRNSIVEEWDARTFNFHNSGRFDFTPIGAPYAIFPLKEQMCTDLMVGKLSLNYNINLTKFEEYIKNKGIDVCETPEAIVDRGLDVAYQYLYCFRSGGFYLKIPPLMLHKMIFEFCHPNMIIKEFSYLKNHLGPDEVDQVLTTNVQEAKLWK